MTTTLASLTNFIRGRATKGSSISLPRQKKKSCNRKIGYRIFWRGREDTFPLGMSFATATLASRIALGLLANFILIGKQSKGKHAIILSLPNKKDRYIPVLFVWRGREDSNFRTGNPAYILSRDASYSLLSTPTRIPLKNGRKPLFTQFALQLYTIFFCLSIVFCFYLKFW